ncbi:MAG: thioredoxin family protein [Candidatus Hydrogenedentes bacterium]|nr:thioredoxin family protein [Candidatus Hydrogenedentota bacterium]
MVHAFRLFHVLIAIAALLAVSPVAAQGPEVKYSFAPETTEAAPGSTFRAAIQFTLNEGFHVNSHTPLESFYIPTVVEIAAENGFSAQQVVYPEHVLFNLEGEELAVYEHAFNIGLVIEVGADVAPGEYTLKGTFRYQACDDKMCFPPDTLELALPVTVGPGGAPQHADVIASITWSEAGSESAAPALDTEGGSDAAAPGPVAASGDWKALSDQFEVVAVAGYEGVGPFLAFLDAGLAGEAAPGAQGGFAGKSWGLILFLIVAGGLALNLTPCVLPLIPVNVAIIGAGARAGSRSRGFALGGAYGAGIALVYGLLGLAVMLSFATAFGTINANPWFNGLIAALFVVLGLAMFDVIQIDFTKFQAKLGVRKNENGSFAIAIFMGCVSALLAGACVAPVVISTILFAQDSYSQGNTLALALPFLLGVGMALPWPFVGAGLSVLPKPGMWMVRVKQAFGVFIIAFAIYYGYQAWTLMRVQAPVAGEVKEGWHTSLEGGLAEALESGKPVFLDFWATWCKNCLVMDDTTLKDPAVVEKLESFVKIKYQAEQPKTSPTKEIMEYYDVIGMPAYLVLQPKARNAGG